MALLRGLWLENDDCTHLVLANGLLFLQKRITQLMLLKRQDLQGASKDMPWLFCCSGVKAEFRDEK